MTRVFEHRVERLIRPPDGEQFWRTLIWRIELVGDWQVRRTLIDAQTGEVLDDAWHEGDGRIASYNAFDRTRLRPPYRRDPGLIKPIQAERRRGSDDQVVDHGSNDRALPRQGQLFPTPA